MKPTWAMALLWCACTRPAPPPPAPPAPAPSAAAPVAPTAPTSVDEKFAHQPITANADPRLYIRCGGFIEAVDGCMVRIPGGPFRMGAQSKAPAEPNYDRDAAEDEGPVHEVTLAPFWIHKLEVSADEFNQCLSAKACSPSEVDRSGGMFTATGPMDHPINGVTWKGATEFCRWIDGRLPTEAEWELAARGTDARRFPAGNETPSCPRTIMNNGCGAGGTSLRDFTGGGTTAFGVLALAGGVWEWTADWYDASYYSKSEGADPKGPATGTERVMRGGGWMSTDPVELRSAYRAHMAPDAKMPDVGFRCVRSDH